MNNIPEKASEIFEGENSSLKRTFDEATQPSKRVEEIVEEYKYNYAQAITDVGSFGLAKNIENFIIQNLTQLEAEKEEAVEERDREIVEIIHKHLRNAPLEVQMTKGIIFADIIKEINQPNHE